MVDFTGGTWRSLIDGSEVLAIPDSEANQKLLHRWLLDDVNGTVEDIVGGADGTNNGVTSLDGDYEGGSAGEGDGVEDYIDLGTLDDFGSKRGDGFAVGFTLKTTDDGFYAGSSDRETSGGTGEFFIANWDGYSSPSDKLSLGIGDDGASEDQSIISSNDDIADGSIRRVVWNVPSVNANDWGLYFNQSDANPSVEQNDASDDFSDFLAPLYLFARGEYDDGSISDTNHSDCIIDDFCIFGESLTESEATSYDNPW